MASLRDIANRFGEIFDEPPLPPLDYVDNYPRQVDLRALTPQEREWLEQAQKEEQR